MFEHLATTQLYAFLLVFCRVGTGFMMLPGISELYVMARARLMLALAVSLLIVPIVTPLFPRMPESPAELIVIMMQEMAVGFFIGFVCRMMITCMHVAGQVISMQSSLASAMMFDVTQSGQGAAIGNMLSVFAVVLIFITNLHHLMIMGFFESYRLFPPDQLINIGDAAMTLSRLLSQAFMMGMKISAPFIVSGVMMYLVAGIMARLMPNLQVFFLMMPAQITLSFFILMITLSAIMLWYLDYIKSVLSMYLGVS